jgi:mono/diheme cytochrome c family protein
MANMALVFGRPSEGGVLGGLSGALANTSLGVPAGAASVSGCTTPSHVPAYGVVDGHLAYLALPRTEATSIPEALSVSRVVVDGDALILYTREADQVATLCRQAHLERTRAVRLAHPSDSLQVIAANTAASAANPASYTAEQAHAGLAVFTASCISCHGTNLQGVAAPAVAGTEFLTSAKSNKWTLADLRTLVVENMPLNNPGTLTPDQYAQVMAFLLASNCYPAGDAPFPKTDSPAFATVHIGPVDGAKPTDPRLGVCTVK